VTAFLATYPHPLYIILPQTVRIFQPYITLLNEYSSTRNAHHQSPNKFNFFLHDRLLRFADSLVAVQNAQLNTDTHLHPYTWRRPNKWTPIFVLAQTATPFISLTIARKNCTFRTPCMANRGNRKCHNNVRHTGLLNLKKTQSIRCTTETCTCIGSALRQDQILVILVALPRRLQKRMSWCNLVQLKFPSVLNMEDHKTPDR
jgi:hypothetical protein